MKNTFLDDIVKHVFFVFIFVTSYFLFYNQVFNDYPSDLTSHISFIDEFMKGERYIPHPMFHYLTYYTSVFFDLDIKLSGVLINSLFVTLLSLSIYLVLTLKLPSDKPASLILFLAFIVLFSGNFLLPGLNLTKYHVVGNSAIAIWHNVTLFAVKPFAVLTFFLFFHAIEKNENKLLLLTITFCTAILSIFAKPSFIIVFFPMLFLFTIFSFFYKEYRKCFTAVLYYFIALAALSITIITMIFYNLKGQGDTSILLDPFKVWRIYSKNIPVSILISNLFIIASIVLAPTYLSVRSWFSVIMLIGGITLLALFVEVGPRLSHGNFGWSYAICQQIAYLSILIDFLIKYSDISCFNKQILNFTLSLHIFGGIYYFYKIFNGQTFF